MELALRQTAAAGAHFHTAEVAKLSACLAAGMASCVNDTTGLSADKARQALTELRAHLIKIEQALDQQPTYAAAPDLKEALHWPVRNCPACEGTGRELAGFEYMEPNKKAGVS